MINCGTCNMAPCRCHDALKEAGSTHRVPFPYAEWGPGGEYDEVARERDLADLARFIALVADGLL